MGDEMISIQDFKDLTDSERKKVKKDVLIQIILNTPESPDFTVLTTAITSLNDMVEGFKKEVACNSAKIVELKCELEVVKDENRKLREDFSSRINNLEQRTRVNNVEIVGLRKPTAEESDTSLAINFFKDAMNAEVSENDIEALHEVPSRRKDRKRVVICHFKSRKQRDDLLKNPFKLNLRNFNGKQSAEKRVFVNEHLSPENRRFFALASKKKAEMNYKFLWTKNGTVFTRKIENSDVIKITSINDIEKMI